jgi:AraC-like DNA-binding protein
MYQIVQPAPALRPTIECYWFIDQRLGHGDALRALLTVDAQPDMLFNFGAQYERQWLGAASGGDVIQRSNLDAQRSFPVAITQTGAIRLVGVRFRILGLTAFLNVPLYQLSDHTHDPTLFFGNAIRTLEYRLYDAPDTASRAALLDEFFLARLSVSPKVEIVQQMIAMMSSERLPLSVFSLSREIGYSSRTLNRLFREMVGFSVKHYARILRFQRAARLLTAAPYRLSEAAFTAGYYDQSHLTKDFVEFTGSPPGLYLEQLER